MIEQAATDALNHRAMPLDQSGEGSFLPMLDEALQELLIGQFRHFWSIL